ncbi:8221_t:CDS:2, partial [Funneliformis geosporum]
FAKEKLEYNNPDIITESKNDNETTYFNNKEKQNNSVNINNKVICRAYVYFCTNFGDSASKVVDLPPTFQSLETLQFIYSISFPKTSAHKANWALLMGEKFRIINILSDSVLKVAGNFKNICEFEIVLDIENSNKIDEYEEKFEEYIAEILKI